MQLQLERHTGEMIESKKFYETALSAATAELLGLKKAREAGEKAEK